MTPVRLRLFAIVILALGSGLTAAQDAAGTRWPVPDVEPLATELALELYVTLSPAVVVGESDAGRRQFIPITGGRFVGDGIRGEVMAGGADWQLVRPDGVLEVNALYSIKTDDGTVIVVDNRGIIAPGATGPNGTAAAPYVRTAPKFHAPAGKYEWLNRAAFLGTISGGSGGGAVVIRVFRVL
jgi:Protein of unknown function (DUF3237)